MSSLTLRLDPFVADIKEPTGATFICLGSRLELDVPVQEPMHSLNEALAFPLSFGIEHL